MSTHIDTRYLCRGFGLPALSPDLQAADKLYFQSRYFEAHKMYESILKQILKYHKVNIQELVYVDYKLGLSSSKISRFSDSYDYLTKALGLLSFRGETNNPLARSKIIYAMGESFVEEAKYSNAEERYKQAIQIVKDSYGEEHQELIAIYNKLAYLKNKQEKHQEALEYLGMAEQVSSQQNIKNDIELATTYSCYASVYRSKIEDDKANDYIQKALVMRQKIYGKSHVEIAKCYRILGTIKLFTSLYSEALDYYNKALKMITGFLGEDHHELAEIYFFIGSIYGQREDYDECLVYEGKALSIQERFLPQNHISLALSYAYIGRVVSNQGKTEEALNLYHKALDIFTERDEEHHSVAEPCIDNMVEIYKKNRQYAEASGLVEKKLTIQLKKFGKTHPQVADTYHDLAGLHLRSRRDKKSLENVLQSIKISNSLEQGRAKRQGPNFALIYVLSGFHSDINFQERMIKKIILDDYHRANNAGRGFLEEVQRKKCLTDLNTKFAI